MAGKVSEDVVLHAKYLDWCSARIAERFMSMSPDEIYELAERATQGPVLASGPYASLSSSATIAAMTNVLADEMELPKFEEWSAAYSEAPEEFDPEMLGFWKEELEN